MMAVGRGPPEGAALHAEQAQKCEQELDGAGRLVGFMAEVAVVDAGYKKHPHPVEQGSDTQGDGAPTGPKGSQASEMKNDEGEGLAPLEAFGKAARLFSE